MWIDLTLPLTENIPLWPKSIGVKSTTNTLNEISDTTIELNLHTGTHIDAPSHAFPGGKLVSDLDHSKLFGIMQVIDTGESDAVTIDHVQNIEESIVFFKTKNYYTSTFNENYCYITPPAAQKIVSSGVSVVGIDYLSVENFHSKDFITHKILLKQEIIIVEGLFLSNICSGKYNVSITPLLLPFEASPVRVFAKAIVS